MNQSVWVGERLPFSLQKININMSDLNIHLIKVLQLTYEFLHYCLELQPKVSVNNLLTQ